MDAGACIVAVWDQAETYVQEGEGGEEEEEEADGVVPAAGAGGGGAD